MRVQAGHLVFVITALLVPLPAHSDAPVAWAASFSVTSAVDAADAAPGDGVCASAAGECSLRAATQEANATAGADTIVLPAGTYALAISGRGEDLGATGDLDVMSVITISGAGSASTIVDGGAIDRVFHVLMGGSLQLSGVTLRNGATLPNPPSPDPTPAERRGGAVYSAGGTVTLTNVVVTGNTSTSGTVYNDEGSTLTVQGSRLAGNSTSFGGGVFNNGTASVVGTTIEGNTSSSGGALYARLGSFTVTRSTISANSSSSATVGGGGVRVLSGGSATITGSLLSANTAFFNGGAINSSGTLVLANVTVSGNSASGSGGGLYVNGGTATVSNATVASNSAAAGGNGIHVAASTATIRNSIVANSGTNCVGSLVSQGYNLDSGASCGFATVGDLQNVSAGLGLLASNGGLTQTHALLSGSAAIDAGSPAVLGGGGVACEAADQRGVARPTDGNGDGTARCDIGAFEAPALSPPTTTPSPSPTLAPLLGGGGGAPVSGAPTAVPSPSPTIPPTHTPAPTATERPTPGVPPAPEESMPERASVETWLLVIAPISLYGDSDELVGEAEPGEWYLALLEEDGWWLASPEMEPDSVVWVEEGPAMVVVEIAVPTTTC